jgi:glyoxylase-like metal-dependent hydrolase (beta-lactamase superfamily II)
LLRAGTLRLDGGGMFGVVPRTIWSKLAAPDEQNRILLQTNCLLLQRDGLNVLIEAGCGDKWSDKERGFFDIQRRTVVDALREAGIAPGQITHVVVTHLHFDHAGGLTRLDSAGRAVPVFENAPVIVQRTEWEDALANKSTMTRTYLRDHLDPIADRVNLLDGEGEVPGLPGVRVMPVPGHTWGLQAALFDDEHGTICFPGDVIPTVHHAGLAFSLGYDMLPYQNMLTKKSLLEQARREDWRLALDHEPGRPVVRVRPHPDRPGQFVLDPV